MTSLLRRKRQTTVLEKSTRSRMAFRIAGLMAVLLAIPVFGQEPVSRYLPQDPVFRSSDQMPTGPVQFQKTGSKPDPAVVQAHAVVETKSVAPPKRIVQAQAFQPKPKTKDLLPESGIPRTQTDDLLEYQIRLEPPSIDIVTQMGSEKALEERMRQEAMQRGGAEIRFPAKAPVSTHPYTPRNYAVAKICAEPRYVSYDRLHFEELNAERYGWNLGWIQPMVSAAYFYKDFLFLPYELASYPHRQFETSAGKCLPGDSVPYILYPPEITLSGIAAEAGVAVGLVPVFP